MNSNNVKFDELNFNGFLIQLTQSIGFDMMINATEMAKSFGSNKRPSFWLELPSTKEYLDVFKSDVQFSHITSVITIKGNCMHRWVALEFARWLNPEFACIMV